MRIICAALFLVLIIGCQQEHRQLRVEPEQRAVFVAAREGEIQAGGPVPEVVVKNPYEGNADAIAEGERLFMWYNCAVCHGTHGGGGMGLNLLAPALTYGDAPDNLFDTISKGRNNGMPSWGGRIPTNQIWQIVTFIRSLRGLEPKTVTPARTEALQYPSAPAAR
jgi:cytochrome c oxidase cbb3-type subunit III